MSLEKILNENMIGLQAEHQKQVFTLTVDLHGTGTAFIFKTCPWTEIINDGRKGQSQSA